MGLEILFSERNINGAQIDDKTAIGIKEKNFFVMSFRKIFSEYITLNKRIEKVMIVIPKIKIKIILITLNFFKKIINRNRNKYS